MSAGRWWTARRAKGTIARVAIALFSILSMTALLVDRYVVDTLMPDLVGHDKHPSAFLVYLVLWARTVDSRQRAVAVSLRELSEGAGISKRAVQEAIARLERRKLITVSRPSQTAVPEYTVLRPWARRPIGGK